MNITMPVFAVSSMFFHEYTCPEIFSFVSAAGLNGMEFWVETPHFWLRKCPVNEVLACWQDHPEILNLNVHAPVLDLNPCSINPRVAAVSVEYAVQSLRLAEQLGAGILTVHPGRRTAKRPPSDADSERFGRYVTALREAAKRTEVKVSMENMEPIVNSMLCTPQGMRVLLDDEPWLSFTLDVAHAIAGPTGDLFRYIELCKDRLVNVHISRADGKQLHLPLDNHPAMAQVIGALREHGYAGPLTLEIEDLNFGRPLTSQEKVSLLARDLAFLQDCFC
jgi:sugar phosphate isomerase/epimerase